MSWEQYPGRCLQRLWRGICTESGDSFFEKDSSYGNVCRSKELFGGSRIEWKKRFAPGKYLKRCRKRLLCRAAFKMTAKEIQEMKNGADSVVVCAIPGMRCAAEFADLVTGFAGIAVNSRLEVCAKTGYKGTNLLFGSGTVFCQHLHDGTVDNNTIASCCCGDNLRCFV